MAGPDREALLEDVRATYRAATGGLPSKQQIFDNLDARFPGWRDAPGLSHAVEEVIRQFADTGAVKRGSADVSSTAAASIEPDNSVRPTGPDRV